MRGFAKFLAIVAFLVALHYARDAITRHGVKGESLEFVTATISTITQNWNRAELDKHADPSLVTQMSALGNSHPLDFAFFAQLGTRVSEVSCKLGDYNTYKNESQNYTAANYACSAQFQRGNAAIMLNVIRNRETDPWRIGYFDVVSHALTPTATPENK